MTDETKIPNRNEISEADKWDLSHLFTSTDKWSEDFAWIQTTYPRLRRPSTGQPQHLLTYRPTAQIVELTAAISFEDYRSNFNPSPGVDAQGFCTIPQR